MTQKRKPRRNQKYLGHSSHGKGNTKNRRGSGGRGGVGRAGMHKHKFSYATTYEIDWVRNGSRRGFANPNKVKVKAMNIYHIQNMAEKGELEKKGNVLLLNFKGRILGTGELTHPVEVNALYATEAAITKIEQAGGKFTSTQKEARAKTVTQS